MVAGGAVMRSRTRESTITFSNKGEDQWQSWGCYLGVPWGFRPAKGLNATVRR
jgi:hypothetical protein